MKQVYKCACCGDVVVLGTGEHIPPDEWTGAWLEVQKTCESCRRCLNAERLVLS